MRRPQNIRPGPGWDDGLSLVEVLVAMMVMSLLGAAIVSTVSSVARGSTSATNRLRATTRAATVSDRLTKYIRAAHMSTTLPPAPFSVADLNHVTFQSDFGDTTGPRQVDIALSGASSAGTLTEQSTLADPAPSAGPSPTYTSPHTFGGAAQTRVLAPGDVDTTATGIFTFYNGAGAALAVPMTTPVEMSRIAQVRITLTTNEPGVAAPVTVTTLVYLRNVEYR